VMNHTFRSVMLCSSDPPVVNDNCPFQLQAIAATEAGYAAYPSRIIHDRLEILPISVIL
jgi:hypothetical protein